MDFGSPAIGRGGVFVIEPERWYSVDAVARYAGLSRDTIIRQIQKGLLKAFVLPVIGQRRRRVYRTYRIQGAEVLRWMRAYEFDKAWA